MLPLRTRRITLRLSTLELRYLMVLFLRVRVTLKVDGGQNVTFVLSTLRRTSRVRQ